MSNDPITGDPVEELGPVLAEEEKRASGSWTDRLVLFLRVMAAVSMLKGLYHWAAVCGFVGAGDGGFFGHTPQWQTATVFFAVIDLVAAVGLWLAAAWGAVIWLMSVASMLAVNIFVPQVFGASIGTGLLESGLLGLYLYLAVKAAQEHPP
jgi:hypothetical protein